MRQEIIKKLYKPRYPITSTTTATAGDKTSVDDTALAGGGHDTDYIGAWIYVAETTAGSPALGEIARVQNVDLAASPASLDPVAPAFTDELQTGMDYEIHYKYHPSVIHDKITEVLDDLETGYLLPLTDIADGDMEDDPATNFTAVTATLVNDTTTVRHGRQSLKITATAALGGALSTAVAVPPNTKIIIAADVYITSGDSVTISVLGSSTSAAAGASIETATSDIGGWVHLEFLVTQRASFEWIKILVAGTANGDVIYLDNLILLPTLGTQITPPDEAEYAADFGSLFYYPRGAGIPGSSNDLAYRLGQSGARIWSSYTIERDDTAIVPLTISVSTTPLTHPLWIETDVDFPALASDTATTQAPKVLVRELALALLWDDMADEEEEQNNLQESLLLRARAGRVRKNMRTTWSEFRPLRSKIWGTKR